MESWLEKEAIREATKTLEKPPACCINWNAPAVYVLGYLQQVWK